MSVSWTVSHYSDFVVFLTRYVRISEDRSQSGNVTQCLGQCSVPSSPRLTRRARAAESSLQMSLTLTLTLAIQTPSVTRPVNINISYFYHEAQISLLAALSLG